MINIGMFLVFVLCLSAIFTKVRFYLTIQVMKMSLVYIFHNTSTSQLFK